MFLLIFDHHAVFCQNGKTETNLQVYYECQNHAQGEREEFRGQRLWRDPKQEDRNFIIIQGSENIVEYAKENSLCAVPGSVSRLMDAVLMVC